MTEAAPTLLPIERIMPHPDNPRLAPREEVIEAIKAQINGHGFDVAHSLIVRPHDGGWQVIAGHHRLEAGRRAGVLTLPCWVRNLNDAEAYMLLVTSNSQSELTSIERGLHALKSGISVREYAAKTCRKENTVGNEVKAARVLSVTDVGDGKLYNYFSQLVEIHAAPSWLWATLVGILLKEDLTVVQTKTRVKALDSLPSMPPGWATEDLPSDLITGFLPIPDVSRITALIAETNSAVGTQITATFRKYSDALGSCNALRAAHGEARRKEQLAIEEAEAKARRLRENVSLEEWQKLDEDTRDVLLEPDEAAGKKFNKQDNDSIEWAMWSWNPISGCLHDCPYCYARDIATLGRTAGGFPNGFQPTLYPSRLAAPRLTAPPREAETDTRYRNVFLGSMADVFGRWVPDEWINAILAEVKTAKRWNFLCLTKFPKRMAEFDIPENMWMGTTIDLQARIPAAETAFAKIKSKVKWLSCEPMLEPLKFSRLELFNWIIIGGASRSSKTPEWRPPYDWHVSLTQEAKSKGLAVYHKTNLLGSRILEMPFGAPIVGDPQEAPAVFHYLNGRKTA